MGYAHGSLTNVIAAAGAERPSPPEVGMLATLVFWTDREPVEVIAVKDGKRRTVTVRRMSATWDRENHGYFGPGANQSAGWLIASDPAGQVETVVFKKGRQHAPCWQTTSGVPVFFGRAEKYEDPTF